MRAYRLKLENEIAVVLSESDALKITMHNDVEISRLIGWIQAALDDKKPNG